MSEHEFKGLLVGDHSLCGTLDGAPRLVVARTGNVLVTDDTPGSPPVISGDVMGDARKKAFDSDWLDVSQVVAEGTGVCSTTQVATNWYQLATWDPLGYIPIVWVLWRSRQFSADGGHSASDYPASFRTRVWDGVLALREGWYATGYSRPTDTVHWIVFRGRAWQ